MQLFQVTTPRARAPSDCLIIVPATTTATVVVLVTLRRCEGAHVWVRLISIVTRARASHARSPPVSASAYSIMAGFLFAFLAACDCRVRRRYMQPHMQSPAEPRGISEYTYLATVYIVEYTVAHRCLGTTAITAESIDEMGRFVVLTHS